jgi:hypothetical protein
MAENQQFDECQCREMVAKDPFRMATEGSKGHYHMPAFQRNVGQKSVCAL